MSESDQSDNIHQRDIETITNEHQKQVGQTEDGTRLKGVKELIVSVIFSFFIFPL